VIIDDLKALPPQKYPHSKEARFLAERRRRPVRGGYLAAQQRCDPSDAGFRLLRMTPTSAT
jgi:hypothetical protein